MNYILEMYAPFIIISAIILIGLPIIVLTFFIIKRLRELSVTRNILGAIYITEEGEAFVEFYADPKTLESKKYVLLEIGKIKPDEEQFKAKRK